MAGPAASEGSERERRDIVSGEILPDSRLVRFVADPQGRVVPDVAAKLPGRGLWVEASRGAVDKAVEKKLFARAAKACSMAGAVMLARLGARSRPGAIAAGALLCGGALSSRWSVFKAGFQSASDPKFVIGPQRARIERGETAGAARHQAKVAEVDRRLGSPATTI